MGVVETKVFRTATGLAVELPDDLGFDVDMAVSIERRGDGVTVTPVKTFDPAKERRKVIEFVEKLRALGPPLPPQKREPIEFPERPGLY